MMSTPSPENYPDPNVDLDALPFGQGATQLGHRLQGIAASRAQLDAEFLAAVAEFDQRAYFGHYTGITSTAHWLAWACSMAAGTAREHVRVARALRHLPKVRERMVTGELSYSKVRELTRLVPAGVMSDEAEDSGPAAESESSVEPELQAEPDVEPEMAPDSPGPRMDLLPNEDELCELAAMMTASQLSRTVRSYRDVSGLRVRAHARRQLQWRERDDQMVELRVLLPTDEAAEVRAALEVAERRLESEGSETTGGEPQNRVDALLDVARLYLGGQVVDPADDHHLVTVHVSAEQLAGVQMAEAQVADAPDVAGDSRAPDVPAGTPNLHGAGGIEVETARRLACDGTLLGAVVDASGDVLALGRAKRLVSRSQRRALGIRDQNTCQFPGCGRQRWLKAHHVVHWAQGGPTDLENLVLLCQFHHTTVHEGHLQVTRTQRVNDPESPGSLPRSRWNFAMPDGMELTDQDHCSDVELVERIVDWLEAEQRRPDPGRIFAHPGGGHGFSLANCVEALWSIHGPWAAAA